MVAFTLAYTLGAPVVLAFIVALVMGLVARRTRPARKWPKWAGPVDRKR